MRRRQIAWILIVIVARDDRRKAISDELSRLTGTVSGRSSA